MIRLAIGCFLILGLVVFLAYISLTGVVEAGQEVRFTDLPWPGPVLGGWAMVGGFGIWIWMLSNFFRRGPRSHRLLWGWLLLLGSYVTATVYFFVIYVQQMRALDRNSRD